MGIDYHAALRNRRVETRFSICVYPSLVWDRNVIAKSEHPDQEALEQLDSEIKDATVVVVLRALTEEESWNLDLKYQNAVSGTVEARALDKTVLLKSFVRFESLDGELLDLGVDDFCSYWDSASLGERIPLLALALQLRTFTPDVPFYAPQSQRTRA